MSSNFSNNNSTTIPTDNGNGDKEAAAASPVRYQAQPYISGMTPSIITTINNTSPTPLIDNQGGYQQATSNQAQSSDPAKPSTINGGSGRSVVDPPAYYESYIEDSFVGHWEREDDDPDGYDYQGLQRGLNDGSHRRPDDDDEESLVHPSTIEFDFDSFGPESFIYTPAAAAASVSTAPATTAVASADAVPVSTTQPEALGLPRDSATQQKQSRDEATTSGDSVETGPQNIESTSASAPTANPAVSATLQKEEEQPKPVNSPRKICQLKPSPVEYLVDPAQIDLKVIEPYKKVISHAGYCHHFDPSAPPPNPGEPAPAVIVFSACYLPDRSRRDYDYVMDHLFLYVLSSLHELIADDYILIYLHNTQPSTTSNNSSLSIGGGGASSSSSSSGLANGGSSTCSSGGGQEVDLHQNNLPTFTWMKRCYQMIDRKLRKNLKILYLVKPTFWLKTIVIMCRPFISGKFSRKLRFIENMDALRKCLPVDQLILPASADYL